MSIIKLSATPSTNSFLRQLVSHTDVENFTVVVAEEQTEGKGQRGNNWVSEKGKNLTFSVFVDVFNVKKYNPFSLNVLVSVSVFEVLQTLKIQQLKIKWPNDILAGNKKIGGILIENVFKNATTFFSIIGVGINVNQVDFKGFPQASSLANLLGNEVDKDILLDKIIMQLQSNFDKLNSVGEDYFWENYHQNLFRKDVPSVFKRNNAEQFQAIIKNVNREGKLCLELENGNQEFFDLKEITICY